MFGLTKELMKPHHELLNCVPVHTNCEYCAIEMPEKCMAWAWTSTVFLATVLSLLILGACLTGYQGNIEQIRGLPCARPWIRSSVEKDPLKICHHWKLLSRMVHVVPVDASMKAGSTVMQVEETRDAARWWRLLQVDSRVLLQGVQFLLPVISKSYRRYHGLNLMHL